MGEHGAAIGFDMLVEAHTGRSLRENGACVALRTSGGSRRRSSPFNSIRSKPKRNTVLSWRRYRMRSKPGMPLSSQATGSPLMMQERERSRAKDSTISGKR
jgi:hypothetical protein